MDMLTIFGWCGAGPIVQEAVGSCIEAAAMIRGAEIQAAATRAAGWMTLGAVFGTVLVGLLAYRAATRETRIKEGQEKARRDGYRQLIRAILGTISNPIARMQGEASEKLKTWNDNKKSYALHPRSFARVPEFERTRWEEHALLGESFVSHVNELNGALTDLNDFFRIAHGSKVDEIVGGGLVDIRQREDGSLEEVPIVAVFQYAHLTAELWRIVKLLREDVGLK